VARLADVYVEACLLATDGSLANCQSTTELAVDGAYTIGGLLPGAAYVVRASADGYLQTYYGGAAGTAVGRRPLTSLTAAPAGQDRSGVDIHLVSPVVMTGTVGPDSLWQPDPAISDVMVWACPVYAADGSAFDPAHPDQAAVDSHCTSARVGTTNGTYTLGLNPDQPYVVIGQADGYTDTWLGGYAGDVVADLTDPVPLPASNQIQLVIGTAGQHLTGDLVFATPPPSLSQPPAHQTSGWDRGGRTAVIVVVACVVAAVGLGLVGRARRRH
jgi:hypothetical protein